ncbi:hydroxyethylthiazole kinase ThiM [Gottschalkia acidurici 9a]|uniref:hydroxyethylthiazole kinase n=2 Tax=Clostridium acidurici TaxID=1556 RepID=K0B1E0_GOTA9|nr:hydroxyethylthiazole kinase ThiM [Gottschalkia acidurici 9a]
MADDVHEVEEMVSVASSLVINIGTLNSRSIESMIMAGKRANSLNIPVILDPVGIRATELRTKTVNRLLEEIKFSVIRGNMAEIKAIGGESSNIKGVDSMDDTIIDEGIIKNIASNLDTVIAMTGAKDIVTDGSKVCIIDNGVPLLSKVTGTGCMSTSLVGTFCGITNNYYLSSIAGIVSMGLAGEMSYNSLENKSALGSFKVGILDNVSSLTANDIINSGNFYEI